MKKYIIIIFALIFSLSGCAAISDFVSTTKGTLLGNSYTIYQFDNEGNLTFDIQGSRIDIEPYQPEITDEGEKVINSVLDITIDGNQVLTVGNTLIFEEAGIDKVAGFEELESINSSSAIGYMPIDKMLNNFENITGKKRTIIIYSQLGKPICIYKGDSVYATVPGDLPKMTRINIDGKSLYLHRVNYTIIDNKLF